MKVLWRRAKSSTSTKNTIWIKSLLNPIIPWSNWEWTWDFLNLLFGCFLWHDMMKYFLWEARSTQRENIITLSILVSYWSEFWLTLNNMYGYEKFVIFSDPFPALCYSHILLRVTISIRYLNKIWLSPVS